MSGIMNMFVAAKTTIATAVDAFFNRVTLLLNTSSTNGAQNNTFLDSSTNNFTITRNGNTTQGTFTPFSQTGWSTHFTGTSGTRLTYPGSASTYVSGTGDFTIEMWINIDPASAGRSRVLIEGDVSNGIQFRLGPSNTTNINGLSVSRVFNADNEYCSYTFEFNTWYHVAVVRASAVYYFFVNGVQQTTQGSGTSTYSFATAALVSIGDNASYPNDEIYKGYISNIRVSSVGRYTSNFTPSTTPLTALSNTQFLSLQDNRWVDRSTNASAISVVGSSGTPSVQAFSPFAPTAAYDTAVVGGSGYFDGSGDSLALGSNAAFAYGLGAITIQFWVYGTVNSSVQAWITNGSNNLNIQRNSSGFYNVYDGTDRISTTLVIANQWNHVAFVRQSSGQTDLYANGVSVLSWTSSVNYGNDTFLVSGSSSFPFTGYVSGLQVLKGTALYTSTFTPPTAPPTAITNTQLLCNFTNSGIYDSTAKNDLETVGNAQVSTTQAKWGTTSMYFDGTGDYLILPASQNTAFGTGDLTIEFWIYYASASGNYIIFDSRGTNVAQAGIAINTGSGSIFVNNGTSNIITGTAPTANAWHHIAFSRSGSSNKLFIDGTQAGSTATSSTNYATGYVTGIGTTLDSAYTASYYLNGYIDDLRITKGYARYTSNFTAPTAAFPLL